MRNTSNFFKMLHNLLESLIIKWNLFILSSREQNFNQHLGISFSKETFLPRRWLWIYYIGDVSLHVWRFAVVYPKMRERVAGCCGPDLRHLLWLPGEVWPSSTNTNCPYQTIDSEIIISTFLFLVFTSLMLIPWCREKRGKTIWDAAPGK